MPPPLPGSHRNHRKRRRAKVAAIAGIVLLVALGLLLMVMFWNSSGRGGGTGRGSGGGGGSGSGETNLPGEGDEGGSKPAGADIEEIAKLSTKAQPNPADFSSQSPTPPKKQPEISTAPADAQLVAGGASGSRRSGNAGRRTSHFDLFGHASDGAVEV